MSGCFDKNKITRWRKAVKRRRKELFSGLILKRLPPPYRPPFRAETLFDLDRLGHALSPEHKKMFERVA